MPRYPEMVVTFAYDCGCSATKRMAYTDQRDIGVDVQCPIHGDTYVVSYYARGV